jgi:hypothetical protein
VSKYFQISGLSGIVSMTDIAGVLREVFLQDQYTQYLVDYLQTGGHGKK